MEIMKLFPRGVVLMWASAEKIPDGWVICDTTHGTPNFNGTYPIGTINKADIGKSVGAESHTHSFNGVTEGATMGPLNGDHGAFQHEGGERRLHTHNYGGTTGAAANYPPSTKIIFIMKL